MEQCPRQKGGPLVTSHRYPSDVMEAAEKKKPADGSYAYQTTLDIVGSSQDSNKVIKVIRFQLRKRDSEQALTAATDRVCRIQVKFFHSLSL